MTAVIGIDHVQLAMPHGGEPHARRFWVDVMGLAEVAKPAHLAVNGGCWFESAGIAIHCGVEEVLETLTPAAMAIEHLFVHGRFPKTANLNGHSRGVICLAAGQAGLSIHDYLPNRVKSMLTGSGHAGKPQIQAAVQRELGLARPPSPPDAADALAIALADYHLRVRPSRSSAPLNSAVRACP